MTTTLRDPHAVNKTLKMLYRLLNIKIPENQLLCINSMLKGASIKLQYMTIALHLLKLLIEEYWDNVRVNFLHYPFT